MPNATEQAAPSIHFFVSSGLGWAVAESREAALIKIAKDTGAHTIRRALNGGGFYVWTCRVLLPQSAHYSINNFMPEFIADSETRVPLDSPQDYYIVTAHGTAVPVNRDVPVLNKKR